ncbi:MAG TPA: phenylalanine--tRNA ligase subunit beta [Jatrophihabitantaceae bacterium]|nr:phenylalanine--tRNA ligase subunit beta [Jatrophihabitantaceae bacterium]
MRAPISWLAEYVDLPDGLAPRELGDALVRVGLEVERVESGADGLSGPIVVGRVLEFAEEPQKNGKTIRWCQVDVGEPEPRGIVCGAHNFAVGDLVVVSLPGAVLPGGFAITARKTYGHVSDGMICSVRELGIGEDHDGILVLDVDAERGADALDVLGLRDAVLDIAITPDRGYCLSVRGLAREASLALGVAFHDLEVEQPPVDQRAYEVTVSDPDGCDQFSMRAVTGLDPAAATPDWMARRLRQSGMRPVSLAVDVTNYVMLETGQPLHAFDRAKLTGPIGVRRATAGEKLTTLDGVVRELDPDDLVVTDDSGPVALAGVMGGASTEIGDGTRDVVLEAAHWHPASISRAVRRHKLPSEAAKRFERGVDPLIAGVALQRCVDLLVQYGGATPVDGYTVIGDGPARSLIALNAGRPAALAGMPISRDTVVEHLRGVGCTVDGGEVLQVLPPSWRPDLTDPADLVEEVVRLVGYDRLPSRLPTPRVGHGLTGSQQLRRSLSRALAAAGYTEVLNYPFVSEQIADQLGLDAGDPRRAAVRLANPLADTEPLMRTTLLPGLFGAIRRNEGRGARDLALFESGLVYFARPDAPAMPRPGVDHRPSEEQVSAMLAAIPEQRRHVAAVLTGELDRPGWWGPGRTSGWADAIEAARVVGEIARVEFELRPAQTAPWHPGRCAAVLLDGAVIGHAGELHPRVVSALGLPERACAMELDVDALNPPPPARAPRIQAHPPVLLDVALVVPADVAAADVLAALRTGAGELLESVRLFDVYRDDARLGAGLKSLAFALRFRADHTLTVEDATAARDAAVAAAAELGARLRT